MLSRIWDTVSAPFGGRASVAEKKEAEAELKERVVTGYRPVLPGAGFWGESDAPDLGRIYTDTPAMLLHPRVKHASEYFKAGIANAVITLDESEGPGASSPDAGRFAVSEARRFWQRHRRAAQRSYEYGRGGAELIYAEEGGALRLAAFEAFMGADCVPLLRGGRFVGVRVRSAEARGREKTDLWSARPGLPAKGWWHAHDRAYSRWHGQPSHYAAWRPWRRLAGRDGAEDIVDGGVYRFAFQPPIGRYPADDNTAAVPGGVMPSNRDKMREMLESLKAGGVVGMSSRTDEKGNYVWDVIWPQGSLDVGGLMAYTDSLEKAISLGCGVPPELIEASEVGSGYSGRAIPLEAFYVVQQGHAEDLLDSWYRQIGLPLLTWNFGPGSWARLRVEDLLKTRMKASKDAQGSGEAQGQPDGSPPMAMQGDKA